MASSFHFAVANLVLFFVLACSQVTPLGHYCNRNSAVPARSPILENINNMLAAMTSASQLNNVFSAFSIGTAPNVVRGLANCRGDKNARQFCSRCIEDAVQQIQRNCRYMSDAQIWYDYCIVRYKQDNFFGTFDASQRALIRDNAPYRDPQLMFTALTPLFNDIITTVVHPANNGMIRAHTILRNGDTLRGGALCTGDLRPEVCTQCLRAAVGLFDSFCRPRRGCRVFLTSCFARYDINPFTASLDVGFNNTLPGQAIDRKVNQV